MKPLRILIGADTYAPDVNGLSRFSSRLAAGLAARGHDVHVVCPSHDGRPDVRVEDGVTVHTLKSHRWFSHPTFRVAWPWTTRPRTARLFAEIAPDVLHVQGHFPVGRGLVHAARAAGTPIVATNHFMPENLVGHARVPRLLQRPVTRLGWWDMNLIYRHADIVTAPTPRAVELLEKATGMTGSLAVSCGIDAARYRVEDKPSGPPTVLFVGRMDQEKRVDELLRAFAALPAGTDARLEIVGEGVMREEWMGLAAELGIGTRTSFPGFVEEDELVDAYRRAAVFCMPGIAELQSIVTLEAMAAGTPVIAANAMALPHLVKPGRNGWLFTPGDVPELTTRLAALLGDAERRRRMGASSLELVAKHELATTLSTFEGIYERLLGRVQRAARAA
ncbi:glycosyltransferase [Pseudonocardia sp.]|uniref:glycosyltransferase n=1 Tax=Pseudonocardia sp. TaxID=60912 RepID=UPI002618388E|nr:glycosyltransferase [Pseudonocardia sp.]